MEKNAKNEQRITDVNIIGENPNCEERHRYNEFFTELNVSIRTMQTAIVLLPVNERLKKMKTDLTEIESKYPDVFEKIRTTYINEVSVLLAYGMIEAKMGMELFEYYHDVRDEENAMELLDEVIAIVQILNIDKATILCAADMYLTTTNYVVVKESKMIQNIDTITDMCDFLEIE